MSDRPLTRYDSISAPWRGPAWARIIAHRIDDWVMEPAVHARFGVKLDVWKDERGIDRKAYRRSEYPPEWPPPAPLSLAGKYAWLAALHDRVCTPDKSPGQSGQGRARGSPICQWFKMNTLPEMKYAMIFLALCEQIQTIGDRDRDLVESLLGDVQRDLNDNGLLVADERRRGPLQRKPAIGRRRGRPRVTDAEHKRLVNAWESGNYRTYAACASAVGGSATALSVKQAVQRERARRVAAAREAAAEKKAVK